jgi:ribosomal protein S18 acetylase RimI-like enzyme
MSLAVEINNEEILHKGHNVEIDFCKTMATDQLICDGLLTVTIGLKDPILNVVIDTQTTEQGIEPKITAVIDFFKRHDVNWTWIVGPLTKPENLAHYLEQQSIVYLDKFPSLYFDLNNFLPEKLLERYDIREAQQDNDLSEWIKPVAESFPTSDKGEGFRQLAAKLPHGKDTAFHHYMAYVEDRIVASSTLYVGPDDSVMIQNLATKHDFRKRGLGGALTLHSMIVAKKMGYKHCFLDASESGIGLYRKIGFQIYCFNQIFGFKKTEEPVHEKS